MKKEEAITLLVACKPLADRLDGRVGKIELTESEQAAIAGFEKVWVYENGLWLADPEVRRAAGLRSMDYWALEFVMTFLKVTRLRELHKKGEPID